MAKASKINPRVIGLGALKIHHGSPTSAELSTNVGEPLVVKHQGLPDLLSWFGVVGGWTKHKRPNSYFRADEDGTLIWIKQRTVAASNCLCRRHPSASERDEGVIKAWGIGVNTPEPILRVIQESDPDVCLLKLGGASFGRDHGFGHASGGPADRIRMKIDTDDLS